MENVYLPELVRIVESVDETPDVRTLKLEFVDEKKGGAFDFRPGQFAEYSVFGAGECTFCIASSPTRRPQIECSFKLVGKVTTALRQCEVGDVLGFRGPYGNWFPFEEMKGKNIVFVGGGIGMAPVRSIIEYCLDNRGDYGEITVLNGARTVADVVYKRQAEEWAQRTDIRFVKTVDPGGEAPGWDGKVGLIPPVLEEIAPRTDDALVIACGPPIMLKFLLMALDRLGFTRDQIVTTLENRMKCGLGKCGRCNVGPYYVCKDGPVFTAAQLDALPPDL